MYVDVVKRHWRLLIGLSVHSSQLSPGKHEISGRRKQHTTVDHVSREIRVLRVRRRDTDLDRAGRSAARPARAQRKELGGGRNFPAVGVIPLDQ